MKYGIIKEQKAIRFKHATSLQALGRLIVTRQLREENFENTKEGIGKYLDSWIEWSQETEHPFETREEAIDTAANTLCYSNIHIIDFDTRSSITNEETDEVCKAITNKLYQGI